jgi:thioredoxin reductase (NADPH)
MEQHEIAIIGAGVAGLTAALYLVRAGKDVVLLEKGAPGGKLLTVSEIANYPGAEKVPGFKLATDIYQSAVRNGVQVTSANVISVHLEGSSFVISTIKGDYKAQAVLVATGLSNVPTIKGEKDLLGKGVSYCATCDGPLYRKKDVALIGNGERSLVEAAYLAPLVNHLYLFTEEKELTGDEVLLKSLKAYSSLEVIPSSRLTEIQGLGHVQKVIYEVNGVTKEVAVAGVFPLSGEKSASAFLSPLGVRMEHGFLPVNSAMETSVPGLFAAGDIVAKTLRQVVTAAGDGANASSGILAYLRKGASL